MSKRRVAPPPKKGDRFFRQFVSFVAKRVLSIGVKPAFADGQIAAVASVNGLVLVTRNVEDYRHFQGVRAARWFER